MAADHVAVYPGSYFETTNDYFKILSHMTECSALANRLPNFIAVDFFELGNNGGPIEAIVALNKEWAKRS
jgi:hypothetical protein